MAFYNKTDDLPRDPSAIDQGYTRGDSIVSAVIVLLIIAAAFGLYFLYGGSGSTTRDRRTNHRQRRLLLHQHPLLSRPANSDTIG